MKKIVTLLFVVIVSSSFIQQSTLKGTWQYCGGIFNGKPSPAPKDYTQLRKYTADKFDAFLLEKGEKDVKYESGTYALSADSCTETQTFCLQDQSMVGVKVRYNCTIRNDTLILVGKLRNGALIEDYWKKVK